MRQNTESSVTKNALSFLTGSFLSRISGMTRDITMAFFLGTSPSIAAFFVAYRLANLLRRLFGEGALLNGFIPHFESLKGESSKRAHSFYRDLVYSCATVLIAIVVIGEGALYFCGGLNGDVTRLTMIMLPGLLFICLFALSSAILHSYGYFFLSGIAPVAFNIVWIASIIFSRNLPHEAAVINLSIAIVVATLFQWCSVLFISRTLSWERAGKIRLFSQEIKLMILPMLYGIIGVGATQINGALDAIFARAANLEGPAYLTYAMRLEQLPIALFAISLATALLPSLSRAYKNGDISTFSTLLSRSMTKSLVILIMGTGAIFCLGGSSVNLIYGHGDFTNLSTWHTTLALWGYGIGLVPMAWSILLAPAFYSRKEFRTPTIISLICIATNLAINSLLIFVLGCGAESVALATSASATLNAILLTRQHQRAVGPLFTPSQRGSLLKIFVASVIATGITLFYGHSVLGDPSLTLLWGSANFPHGLKVQLLHFCSQLALFGIVIGGVSLDTKRIFK